MKKLNMLLLTLSMIIAMSGIVACNNDKNNSQSIIESSQTQIDSSTSSTTDNSAEVSLKISFIVDSEIYATVDTNGKEIITMPDNPTKIDYEFDGWYWDKDEWEKPFTANSLLDAPLSSDMSVYAKFINIEENTPPNEATLITELKKAPNIIEVEAATEYNDPNGQLGKDGAYISQICFSVDVIDQTLISGATLVEKGTDAGGSIEIYRNKKDAKKRNTYLSAFDGGILSSGSHTVIGTCVVRTSHKLTATLQNILEGNIIKILTGDTEAFISMDTYLFQIAKQIAEKDNLSAYETTTALTKLEYPLKKVEQIVENCNVNWNGLACAKAVALSEKYATVYPAMIVGFLDDSKFLDSEIEYALETANIDWQYYVVIHAKDYINRNESSYISPLDVLAHLNNEKGYAVSDSEYGVANCNVNWNEKALEYIEYIDQDGEYGPKGDYVTALTDEEFTKEQAEYAVANCGKDWNNHALICLTHFVEDLSTTPPNHTECVQKLKEWGFNDTEINYALNNYDGLVYPDKLDYVLSFDTDGGNSIMAQNVIFGQTYTLPTPAKQGHTFVGWYNGNEKIENGTWYIASNITVKAKWNLDTYTVNYNLDGGENNTSNPKAYTYNAASISLKEPTKTGYTFIGWTYVNQNTPTKTVTIAQGEFGDKTYTANWQANIYTVTYEVNGGSLATLEVEVEYNSYFKPATPTRTGYSFNGWHYDSGKGYDEEYCNDYYTIESDITLEAWWNVNSYTITYDANGGTVNSSTQTVKYDSAYTLRTPTRTGYTFLGWYQGTNKIENGTWTKTNDIELKAKWKANFYARINASGKESETGEYILFGSYPQSKVTDATLTNILTAQAGVLPTRSNNYNWTSYGYYINSSNTTNFMWYQDEMYLGEKYRGVYFTSYRPYYMNDSSSNTYQDDNGYSTSMVYWFKYEPIRWRILEEKNGYATILCEMIIDSQAYAYTINGSTVYENSYEYSAIRTWLNYNFYNTAFDELEQAFIQTVTVDNSATSTGESNNSYVCNDTEDKVWLLSYQEATTYEVTDTAIERQKQTTDYAQCQGAYTRTDGNGYWWLRSPHDGYSLFACYVYYNGAVSNSHNVYHTDPGIVPAVQIRL